VLKCPSVCLEIRAFLTYLLGGRTFVTPSVHLPHQTDICTTIALISPEQKKEVTFDGRLALANVRAPVSQDLIKVLHEITVNRQG